MKKFLSVALAAALCAILVLPLTSACAPAEPVYTLSDDQSYYVMSGYTGYSGNLKELTVPAEYQGLPVKEISSSAFTGCSNLTSLIIEYGVEFIGDQAFLGCRKIESVSLPNSVKQMGFSVFAYCFYLQSVTLSENLTQIPQGTFGMCTNLNKIYVPDSVTEIGPYAFMECSSLSQFDFPENLQTIGESAFCRNYLTSITLPNGIMSIGKNAFYASFEMTEATVGEGLTELTYGVFGFCPLLAAITLPSTLIKIVGDSETNGTAAFYATENLNDIYYNGTQEQWVAIEKGDGNDVLLTAKKHYAVDG